jgi:RHS repeat-associated protein
VQGSRVGQTVDSVATQYLLDVQPELWTVLAATASGQTERYLHGPLGIHAQEDNAGDWRWMVPDALGSVRGEFDADLDIQAMRDYAPYGDPFGEQGSFALPYGFTNEYTDATGLLYLRARYYDPAIGRFLNMDPSWQERNLYGYVGGNPVNFTDPSGHITCDPVEETSIQCAEKIIEHYAGALVSPVPGDPKQDYRPGSGLEALARLFTEPALDHYGHMAPRYDLVGNILYSPATGLTARQRLRFIITLNTDYEHRWRDRYGQGRINFGDCGLRVEFQDRLLVGGPDNAIGRHLMLAIRMGFENDRGYWAPLQAGTGLSKYDFEETAIRLIIGHEVGVYEGSTERDEAQSTTDEDITDFRQALQADIHNDPELRNTLLQNIFARHEVIRAEAGLTSLQDEAWRGGTFQDLLLSLKGFRFGQEVRNGSIATRYEAAQWLRTNLGHYGPSFWR